MTDKTIVEVEHELFIPFDYKDLTPGGSNLGRAEFMVCLKYYRRKIVEFWVDPIQTHIPFIWHVGGNEYGDFSIQSYNRLESPKAWLFGYCATHKCPYLSVYAPDYAKFLRLSPGNLAFTLEDWNKL